ncbi:MAG: recombinase family protein [Actinomycetota bacterium]|nr:recombinase family protein [Actinomycetota bacterium]
MLRIAERLRTKISARHLERAAYVYVRQSTHKQVRDNHGSRANQYALLERAVELGWHEERVRLVDDDQGLSAKEAGGREGFKELVGEVSLGHAGIVLAYEASRLARNNADWYALLDVAALRGTLIADSDGVYDPADHNDRLLLGLRGMMSEAEIHLFKLRLEAGRLRRVEQGTYRQALPTGLVRLEDGRAVKDPDVHVRRTIGLVFERFEELGSAQKVMRSFKEDGLLLPRRQVAGLDVGELLWKLPSVDAIYGILHNPAYAGAFAYGRTGANPDRRPGRSDRVRLPIGEWATIHQGVYPAYVSWERFLENQQRLADNASGFERRVRGAPRDGTALLAGIAVCARCGHKMRAGYKRSHRYVCNALSETYRQPMCLSLPGPSVDAAVVEAFFEAIRPAELDLLEEVLAERKQDRGRLEQQHADRLKRTEYEARLAEKRYRSVDPENRLVAAELEKGWEAALRSLVEAREASERFERTPPAEELEPGLRTQLEDLGKRLPELWESGRLSPSQKKELLRSLVRRVVLSRPEQDIVEAKVVWVSGAYSVLRVNPPVLHRTTQLGNHDELVARTLKLAAEGHQDTEIARRLTKEGFRSARLPYVTRPLVEKIRTKHGQTSLTGSQKSCEKIDGNWSVPGLALRLGTSETWLRGKIAEGAVPARRHPTTGRWLIPDDPALLARIEALAAARRRR